MNVVTTKKLKHKEILGHLEIDTGWLVKTNK